MSLSEYGFKPTETTPAPASGRGRQSTISKPIVDAFLASGETCAMREFADKRGATKLYTTVRYWLRHHTDVPVAVRKRGCSVYLVRRDAE